MLQLPMLSLAAIYAVLLVLASSVRAALPRPNMVLVLMDDLGLGEVNAHAPKWAFPIDPLNPTGGKPLNRERFRPQRTLATPNLQRFAELGMRAVMAYAPASLCTPSRASILLGRGVGSTGFNDNDAEFELTDTNTFTKKIKSLGYRTAYFGKWGLGDTKGGPWNHGFDLFVGQTGNVEAHCVFPKFVVRYNSNLNSPPATMSDLAQLRKPIPENSHGIRFNARNCPSNPNATCVYVNDIFRDEFFEFLKGESGIGSPFFAMWAPSYPHVSTYNPSDPYNPRHQAAVRRYSRATAVSVGGEFNRGHASRIEAHMDVDMGQFLDLIRSKPVLENRTLVIITSDNGPPPNFKFFQSYGGLRGGKRNVYEAGVRVPTIVRWPGMIPEGTVSRIPFALYELANVFTQLASIPSTRHPLLLAWRNQTEIASRPPMMLKTCVIQRLKGGARGPTTCTSATYDLSQWQTKLPKLITTNDGNVLLYNLVADPKETTPILGDRAAIMEMVSIRNTLDSQQK